MNRYVCIHAHCYQPPRENPWLEEIEQQDSAYPHHDWNERVNAECYAQNVASRILDARGRIARILNNFSRISFNIGPTLLSWMEHHDPDTYRGILRADHESRERFGGHGSAIAQAYNHMILPLANERDRHTQVRWGIEDFIHRFGRRPEGMWLPETAVDLATLEVLAENELAFTILSPYQAKRVRRRGETDWLDVAGGRIDPSQAYLHSLPSGRSIAVFFYDGPVAQAVAFERLLDSGERFAQRLEGGFSERRKWPQLMHIATDGESYGHHHRSGEMALSYALDLIDREKRAEMTIYGEYLERHPPTHEVEILEDTAWSCSHGVGRWRESCGCNTGGQPDWSQEWRGPLRKALDWLRDELATAYERAAADLFIDPWAARDALISVLLDRRRQAVEAFLATHQRRPLTGEQQRRALMLLEMQRHLMLMYTSCGWFFDDLSGIETVQVIQYAGRAVQLAESLFGSQLEESFVGRLARARSNLPAWRDGRAIYEKNVKPAMVNLTKVGAHYAISSLFQDYPQRARIYCYDVERQAEESYTLGRMKMLVGRAHIASTITWNDTDLAYAVLHFGDTHVLGGVSEGLDDAAWETITSTLINAFMRSDVTQMVRIFDRHFTEQFALPSLFRDEQRKVLRQLIDSTVDEVDAAYQAIYRNNAPLIAFLTASNMPVPRPLRTAAEHALTAQLERAFDDDDLNRDDIESILTDAAERCVQLDEPTLRFTLQQRIEREAQRLAEDPLEMRLLARLRAAVDIAGLTSFGVELWKVQNIYWELLRQRFTDQRARAQAGDDDATAWCQDFLTLGDQLRVSFACEDHHE